MENIKEFVISKLRNDMLSCDFLWSIFTCAVFSYRHDSVLRPFPSQFSNGIVGEIEYKKDIDKLRNVTNRMPSLPVIIQQYEKSASNVDNELLSLLHWVINTKSFTVTTVAKSTFAEIMKKTDQQMKTAEPAFIFELNYCDYLEEKFLSKQKDRNLIYTYHGSRMDNFYSILQNGLRHHMNKNSVFGEGTYLSSELSVCINYSPTMQGWDKSSLGKRMSCVVVCQVIDHPDVKHQLKSHNSKNSTNDIPEKYYLVQNDELVRIKYVLVFIEEPVRSQSYKQMWLFQNRFSIMMAIYVIALIAIGLGNSGSGAIRRLLNKFVSS